MKRILFTLAFVALAGTHLGTAYVGARAGRYLQASTDQKLAVAHSCGVYDTSAAFRWRSPEQVQILDAALAEFVPTRKPRG